MTGEMAGTQRHTPSPPLTDFHLSVFSRSIQKIAIDFHLVKSDMVIAKVYNISGREMVKLIDGHLGTGMQRISWDTKNVAAGYYTLRMRVGSIFYVKSILVSR